MAMAVLRSAHPPPVAELARWTLNDYGELRPLRTALQHVMNTHNPLSGPILDDVTERMTIVVTELATNALRHAGPPTVIRLSRTTTAFVLDVADQRPSAPPQIAERRPAAAGGHGLKLTTELAHDCGWYPDEDTKHVWALFETPPRPPVRQTPRIAIRGLESLIHRLRRLNP